MNNITLISTVKTGVFVLPKDQVFNNKTQMHIALVIKAKDAAFEQIEVGTIIPVWVYLVDVKNNQIDVKSHARTEHTVAQTTIDAINAQSLQVLKTDAFKEQMFLSLVASNNLTFYTVPNDAYVTKAQWELNHLPSHDNYVTPTTT